MRYLFFCAYGVFPARRFSGAAFSHTRAYAYVGICAYAHTCATHAHLFLAREERNFSCRRFMNLLRSFFIRRATKKQNCGISGGKQCRSLQNPVKNVKLGLKRLRNGFLRRWKGDIRQKNGVNRRKKGKKEKNEKKLKNFKKVRKNSWQGVYKCGIIVKLTNERTSTAGRTPVKQAD